MFPTWALWAKNKSAKVNTSIASPTGTALIPTQGSCLPLVLISILLPSTSTEFLDD